MGFIQRDEKMRYSKKIGYILILFVIFLLLFDSESKSMQSANAIIPDLAFEGEYKVGDGEWMPYQKGEHISATSGDVYLKGELKMFYEGEELGNLPPETPIAFYGNHLAVEIIEGDITTKLGPEIEQIYPSSCEKNWIVYTYLGESPEKLEIHVHNTHKYGNENAIDEMMNNLEIYESATFEENKIKESAFQIGAALFVILCAFAVGGVYLFAKITNVNQSSHFMRMACLMLLAGLCMIFSDKNIALLVHKYTFNTMALGVCRMLYILCVVEVFYSYMHEDAQRKINKLIGVMKINIIITMLVTVFTDMLFYDVLFYWGIGQALICVVMLGVILKDFINKRAVEHWSIAVEGLVCFTFIVDFVAVYSGVWDNAYVSGIVFFVLFFVGCMVLMYTIPKNINAAERARKLEQELNDSRIAIMMSQIRTHFIFNVMNAISALCSIDPKKADEALIQFSRYLRRNTSIMEEDEPIPFSKEMQHLEDYVSLEKLRFGDRVSFEKEIEIMDFVLPPLTVQPLVENAIKHGFIELGESGKVILKTKETEDEIQISIIDNGVGFEPEALEKEASVGVRNVRYRLERMVNGRLEIKSVVGEGTQVIIHLPKRKRR